MQAQQMLTSGCMCFLASAIDKSKEEGLNPTDVSVVRKIVKKFPKELPGLPQVHEISIGIELGTCPISKSPCRMALTEWL